MDHIERLNRTIDYIEANLDKVIHLELLAKKFALSKYHFHRTGKTPTMDLDIIRFDHRHINQSPNSLIQILIPIQS